MRLPCLTCRHCLPAKFMPYCAVDGKNRVKGRDLYDYVFYLQKGATVNLQHLQQRLIQSGAWEESKQLTLHELKKLLCERFESIDYENAKSDVQDFIKDKSQLNLWSSAFFKSITENLL